MEDVAYKLAELCVATMIKSAKNADPRKAREEFEGSAEKEKVLRRHGSRLGELAKTRAADEDTSLGGYASTAASRMLPIPQTGTEALTRLPLVAAGGIVGHQVGKSLEDNSKAVKSVFSQNPAFRRRLEAVMNTHGLDTASSKAVLDRLGLESGADLQGAFGPMQRRLPSLDELKQRVGNLGKARSFGDLVNRGKHLVTLPGKGLSAGARSILDDNRSTVGAGAPSMIRQELKSFMDTAKDLPQGSKLPRYLGAAGGIGAASLATGAPLAVRSLWNKHLGGDAAVRARSQMNKAISAADSESSRRDQLLSTLPQAQVPVQA